MKIKETILSEINNVVSRKRICNDLDISDQMLYKHIKANKRNGRLTKMDALKAISKETGRVVDDIIEEK
jgi:biotin operon repressor